MGKSLQLTSNNNFLVRWTLKITKQHTKEPVGSWTERCSHCELNYLLIIMFTYKTGYNRP